MTEYKIGILDDDQSKITQLIVKLTYTFDLTNDEKDLLLKIDNASNNILSSIEQKKIKYQDIKLNASALNLTNNMEHIIDEIRNKFFDCILIDYKLSSKRTINFSGIDFAIELKKILPDFPIFIITSYEEDLYEKETFDVYNIFNFERYMSEPTEKIELHVKIIEQIKQIKKQQEKWEEELLELLAHKGESLEIDQKIIELDTKIEQSLNKKTSLPIDLKSNLLNDKLDLIINKIDKILKEDL